jgi:molecular chaperone DnaK
LIAQLVSAELERPVAVDAHPKHAIALGAALAASAAAGGPASRLGPPDDRTEVRAMGAAPTVVPAQTDRLLESSRAAEAGAAEPSAAEPAAVEPSAPEPRPPDADRSVPPPGSPTVERTFADASSDDTDPADASRRIPVLAAAVVGVLALAGGAYALASGNGPDESERVPASMEADPDAGSDVEPAPVPEVGSGPGVDEPSRDGGSGAAGQDAPDVPDRDADHDAGSGAGSDREESPTADGSDGGTEDPATTAPDEEADEQPSGSEDDEAPSEDDPGPSGSADELSTAITDIALDDGVYLVSFTTDGFTASLPEPHHVHFFFDTVAPSQAGRPGSGPWEMYGGPSPFTGYTVEDRPDGAAQLCVLVAEPDHSVRTDTGNCRDLP